MAAAASAVPQPPSAEVQGHGPGQEMLQTDKREVQIVALEPIGHCAVQPTFSDGHESGIFTREYLHQLGAHSRNCGSAISSGSRRPAPIATRR